MKNAHQILSSIKSTPEFSKLDTVEGLQKMKTLFNPYLQKMISYSYIKNGTLIFVLTHPGAKQEFDNTLASIKDALKILASRYENINFENVRAYAKYEPQSKFIPRTTPQLKYYEMSDAKFSNTQDDEKLKESFERIREIIQNSDDVHI